MTNALSRAELRAGVADVVYTSTLHLDENDFEAWLEHTAPQFRYRIQAFSPDIRKNMTWLDHDRAGLSALIELLPRHHVDNAQWLRHVVLYSVIAEAADRVRAVSSLAIFHTVVDVGDAHLEGGSSRVFAVGRYRDRLELKHERWLLTERTVELETRQLGIGSHWLP
ncbi:MAG TPA: nuclear transport factor 2 family protein [Polyangiaceae bacterium]|nr:nuclear transport factor 2 family protein [Polyangiaceae bacterium]